MLPIRTIVQSNGMHAHIRALPGEPLRPLLSDIRVFRPHGDSEMSGGSFLRWTETMKALEVVLDGKLLGVFVPPKGGSFVTSVGNIPRKY